MIAGKAAVNFLRFIFLLTGPNNSFPLADILFFKSMTLFFKNLIQERSLFKISFLVRIITPTIFVFTLSLLLSFVTFTLVLTKFPIEADLLFQP
jgi:hypothetical protein